MMLEPRPGYKQSLCDKSWKRTKRWQLISEFTRGRVAKQPDNSKSVELALENCSTSHEVTFLLNSLPKTGGKQDDKDSKSEKLKENKVKKTGFDKNKKDKKDKKEFSLPDGASSHTAEGKSICRNWNQGRCRFAEAGKRCKYSRHVCWKCFRPKAAHECTHS